MIRRASMLVVSVGVLDAGNWLGPDLFSPNMNKFAV